MYYFAFGVNKITYIFFDTWVSFVNNSKVYLDSKEEKGSAIHSFIP